MSVLYEITVLEFSSPDILNAVYSLVSSDSSILVSPDTTDRIVNLILNHTRKVQSTIRQCQLPYHNINGVKTFDQVTFTEPYISSIYTFFIHIWS